MAASGVGLAAVERLTSAGANARRGRDDQQWLGAAIARYLQEATSGLNLDWAVGVSVTPGAAPWWRQAAELERNRLIRELAGSLSGSTHSRLVELQRQLRSPCAAACS